MCAIRVHIVPDTAMVSELFREVWVKGLNKVLQQIKERRGLVISGAALIALVAYLLWPSSAETGSGFRTSAISTGSIRQVISATGNLAAVSTVEVGTQVSGQVIAINADFNTRVNAEQVIAQIDPESFQARVNQALADLSSAEANLTSAQAQSEEARLIFANAERDLKRQQDLLQKKLISQSILDAAQLNRDQATAKVSVTAAAIRSAQANVQQRKAAVENAKLELKRTEIRAPVDGVIISRTIELGQTVAASFQTPVLFSIAEDLAQMQIVLAIDEADIGQVRSGQAVKFSVDAFPGRNFNGRVAQVRLASTNTQGVITYPVVVAVDNSDLSLLPGLTANAEIQITERNDVKRVPLRALSFKPATEVADPFSGRPSAEAGTSGQGQRPGAAGGAMMNEVIGRLQLDEAQQERLRGAIGEARQKMMASAPSAGGQNGAGSGARGGGAQFFEQILTAIRPGLNEDQLLALDELLAERRSQRNVTVYTLKDGQPAPVQVRVGLSDSEHAELLSDQLNDGDLVIIGMQAGS